MSSPIRYSMWLLWMLVACMLFEPSHQDNAIDVLWQFSTDNECEGWAKDTTDQMHIDVTTQNDQLTGIIYGTMMSDVTTHPYIESPPLSLDITPRHFISFRMMYYGIAKKGNVLLKSGGVFYEGLETNNKDINWRTSSSVNVLSDGGTSHQNFTADNAIDGDKYTKYLSTNALGSFLIFDLHHSKHINILKILNIGDDNSAKNCLLQKSLTSGVGPFITVHKFKLEMNSTDYNQFDAYGNNSPGPNVIEQTIVGFSGSARFWRVIFLDNYGGNMTGIRDITFSGYSNRISIIPFDVISTLEQNTDEVDESNSYRFHTYYIPINSYISSKLLRFRIEFEYNDDLYYRSRKSVKYIQEYVSFDYIAIMQAPNVFSVKGCLEKYSNESTFVDIHTGYTTLTAGGYNYNVTTEIEYINQRLAVYSYQKNPNLVNTSYSITYDCPLSGGLDITILGTNFGSQSTVFVDNVLCPIVSQNHVIEAAQVYTDYTKSPSLTSFDVIVCQLPASRSGSGGIKLIRVENAQYPSGLYQEVPFLSYRTAPPRPLYAPMIANIGARRIDLLWEPPSNQYEAMTITGYKILWFQPKYPSRVSNITVGNITLTSIRGLASSTEYVFAIAAVSEGSFPVNHANLPTDLYGRRDLSPTAVVGEFSPNAKIIATLANDFDFGLFNSNRTLNNSNNDLSYTGSSYSVSGDSYTSVYGVLGPTGMYGSEGSYGLVLVGNANIENCNVSSTCCDGYNATLGITSCNSGYQSVCAVLPERMLAYDHVIDGLTRREVPSNLPYSNGKPAGISFSTLEELISNKGALLPSKACGPALRLTASEARLSGAAWYRRKVNVREGFDTTFKFRISNPSLKCNVLDDVNTFCRSRGADGLAFVIQNISPTALGVAGSGLGYEGIHNSLSVELDTFHNFENMDFYENHIAVMTRGYNNISANHSTSLAIETKIPDLTDGIHTVRIKYDPKFDETAVPHPSFQVNGYTSSFLENADFINGGEGSWGTGFGLLYVYVDDLYSPIITTALNLEFTISLDDGRAFVGLTAATGENNWQAHDILEWQFTSLYSDIPYTPPFIMNGEGAHSCVDDELCVHHPDYHHYMRSNNVFGPSFDASYGWQSGTEGYCATC